MKTISIKLSVLIFALLTFILNSCSEDNLLESDPFVVAFESLSKSLITIDDGAAITLVYSEAAIENGSINIQITPHSAIYGYDFITVPEAINNGVTLPISNGESKNEIVFKKLNSSLDETTKIEFKVKTIAYSNSNIQGNSIFIINASAALGGTIYPEIGGPNEENQVFIDLSSENSALVKRDSWDLGFCNGDAFRVAINGSVYMAAKALVKTNIDTVTENDVIDIKSQVAVGTFNPENEAYIDAPNGNILETAIKEVSENNNKNPVYLINLGYEVGTTTPTVGDAAIAGNARGWKKIRILRDVNNYILQYANLNDTSHEEITISKNEDYNFNHFSFYTNTLVDVEPKKEKWDISFTVFTNIIEGAGSYGFSDYVTHNSKNNTLAYQVETKDLAYDTFSLTDVNTANFSEDQTIIGSNWRDVFSRSVFSDRFYILKDSNENIYKIKFLAMTNDNGERGYPKFEYKLLQ